MQTLFQKMRANRGRWIKPPIQAAEVQPAPEVLAVQPFMVVGGQRYVEAPASSGCDGCDFLRVKEGDCRAASKAATAVFGHDCFSCVIYLKAE